MVTLKPEPDSVKLGEPGKSIDFISIGVGDDSGPRDLSVISESVGKWSGPHVVKNFTNQASATHC